GGSWSASRPPISVSIAPPGPLARQALAASGSQMIVATPPTPAPRAAGRMEGEAPRLPPPTLSPTAGSSVVPRAGPRPGPPPGAGVLRPPAVAHEPARSRAPAGPLPPLRAPGGHR